ncbi:M1 family aminopeptidase [Candidatus Laterigemmans baculatus]|uniref:M1 family aminopeptidase n=1 Tax=Candidatus Laterigemmans baculatus TaxID=2770505 RepID=UPI0013DD2B94|nr:M1 family aminopeptidase [Candidatus Laterigemmans baculatus]
MLRFRIRQSLLALLAAVVWLGPTRTASAQPAPNAKNENRPDAFRQLEEWLPTPNVYRTASGEPGPQYWQQRADYVIDIALDDDRQRLSGSVEIVYTNHSPQSLRYVWLQLDQNRFRPDSTANRTAVAPGFGTKVPFTTLRSVLTSESFDGGYKITAVTDGEGQKLPYTIVDTMMRVDLPAPLTPDTSSRLRIEYSYNIVDATLLRARAGYEFFEDDGNYIYEIAQWYPRVVAYTDYTGWQHKQFLGFGEFTLELGNYRVAITAPADHIVAATGTLQNPADVLSETQRERLDKAATAEKPVFIVTPDEAKKAEEAKKNVAPANKKTKTWIFEAENVRDFAFASSRKFIWDAMGHNVGGHRVMAMSYYPREAEPLWSQYSTASIIHTLNVYGRYTFEYPYPTAISVNGPIYGMEYPMICFNGPRPDADGTYSERTKYGLISVIIHEVGHNYFPMIVNSDERQWTWMDEGLNTFLQYLAEQEWEEEYPSRRGEPADIASYMRGTNQVPIMTNSESILQFGPNAYAKPATALNILRETILGRELFDFAFKEYARRWKFKRPTPADFFRTMEDASGVDLDWFWRGWFYSTDHVDIAISQVQLYKIDSGDPDERADRKRREREAEEPTLSNARNESLPKFVDLYPGLKDFYNDYDDLEVFPDDRKAFQRFVDSLDDEEKRLIKRKSNFYVVTFTNQGGLVMPIILRIHYTDGTSELLEIPAEIWRRNSSEVKKLIIADKELARLELDPRRQTADTEYSNNHWPPKLEPTRFELFKDKEADNPMKQARKREQKAEEERAKTKQKKDGKESPEKELLEVKKPDSEKPSLNQPEAGEPPAAEQDPAAAQPTEAEAEAAEEN